MKNILHVSMHVMKMVICCDTPESLDNSNMMKSDTIQKILESRVLFSKLLQGLSEVGCFA